MTIESLDLGVSEAESPGAFGEAPIHEISLRVLCPGPGEKGPGTYIVPTRGHFLDELLHLA